ncbi:MAG: peptide chain release factor N(5)-glutamine methyltransferase [Clostridia bacterium]|nr:peptide chain release factor N(5)-glutamine methyltransferase [Clostridia bacterium]
MTYGQICVALENAGIDNYRYEARLLIEELCGSFSEEEDYPSRTLSEAVIRRCERYPLQYILGKWWFARCELEVNESCLVPRPDTELIVELAQKLLPKEACFADLCTGSGCIAVATLDLRPDTSADAYELYPDTLALATRNAEKNRVAERFHPVLGDVLVPELLGEKKYAAILSNPPYIRSDVIPTLDAEVKKEPHAALDGGEDGLIFYRAIMKNFAKNLDVGGFFLFEIGFDQANDLKMIAEENGFSCEIYKDLGGCDRAALCRINDSNKFL